MKLLSNIHIGVPFGKASRQCVPRAMERPVPRDLVMSLWDVSFGNNSEEEMLCCHQVRLCHIEKAWGCTCVVITRTQSSGVQGSDWGRAGGREHSYGTESR